MPFVCCAQHPPLPPDHLHPLSSAAVFGNLLLLLHDVVASCSPITSRLVKPFSSHATAHKLSGLQAAQGPKTCQMIISYHCYSKPHLKIAAVQWKTL